MENESKYDQKYFYDILKKNNPTTTDIYQSVPLRLPKVLNDLYNAEPLELYAEIWRLRYELSKVT